jgi:hypothetical protein
MIIKIACDALVNSFRDEQIKKLLTDTSIVRIVKLIDRASLSLLELLEYGITRKDINHALGAGVIVFDKARVRSAEDAGHIAAGDYYFDYLNSKVKLSELGIQVLEYSKTTESV